MAPAASMVTVYPPLPMLSEAHVLPVAAADKLTLDSWQIGKKRFPRSAQDLLALTPQRCVGGFRLGPVPTCQRAVLTFGPCVAALIGGHPASWLFKLTSQAALSAGYPHG